MEEVIETRPWGSYEVLLDAPDCKVKRIIVKAGQRLSLQSHKKREEHWIIVRGEGEVTLGNGEVLKRVFPSDRVYVPRGFKHRIQAICDLTFIEVQLGSYFGEDDIERFSDDYGRK